jgi:hypothetical protein
MRTEMRARRGSAPGARWSAATCETHERGEAWDVDVTLSAWTLAEASKGRTSRARGVEVRHRDGEELGGLGTPAARRKQPRRASPQSGMARPQVEEE